ncbi:MAG: 23S rRNA (guanosine(2251)-2'-O)-methyltransferase RlmB [Lentimicrobiaceae bacterium]
MKDNNLIYGIRPAIEAIKAGKEVDKLFLQTGLKGELIPELRKLINENHIPYQYVPVEKLNRMTRGNHQGVACYISEVIYQPLDVLLMSVFEKGETPLFIILDRITDVRNMGAIARSAVCAGAHGIIIPDRGGAPVNADAVKTSAGALNIIPVHKSSNLKTTIEYLKQSGLRIVSVSEKGKTDYFNSQLTGPLALIMGSEEDGVSGEYLSRSDEVIRIPMQGEISSLNVSVAAGIVLFDVVRQNLLSI